MGHGEMGIETGDWQMGRGKSEVWKWVEGQGLCEERVEGVGNVWDDRREWSRR